jgi:hypothetical protein
MAWQPYANFCAVTESLCRCYLALLGIVISTSTSFKLDANMAPKTAQQRPSNPLQTLWKAYNETTPDRLKFIDSFLLFLMLSGIIQFVYCVLVTNFPFNAFLAG